MRIFCAVAVVAVLAGPAYAQDAKPIPKYGEVSEPKSSQEIASEKAADRAYKNSLGNIPDKGPVDPWGGARGVDASKSAAPKSTAKAAPAKTAKTTAKPGVTTN